ncbi:MAG TPA: hypothetical protein DDZ04_05705 [Parabacteroides sp.]|nr:hypothetical protein [Parabacteroides sp.]
MRQKKCFPLFPVLILFVISWGVHAQDEITTEKHFRLGFGADFVSSYVWRGLYQGGFSVQPGMSIHLGHFGLTAWGSTDFQGSGTEGNPVSKEIDLVLSYDLGKTGLGFAVSDYWWADKGKGDFFNYKSADTDHAIEAGISYDFPFEKFPMSMAWYTFFWGADKKENGKQNHSSYFELTYPFKVKQIDLEAALGIVPYSAAYYETDKFGVTNLSLTASSSIPLSRRFALPVFVQTAWNLYAEEVYLLLGLSLAFGDY